MATASPDSAAAAGAAASPQRNLTCGLCRNTLRSPRLLPCYHTFCLLCLERLLEDRTPGDSTFLCPNRSCGSTLQVPPGGARGFMRNQYVAEQLGEERRLEASGSRESRSSSTTSRSTRSSEGSRTSHGGRRRPQGRGLPPRSHTFRQEAETQSRTNRRAPPRAYTFSGVEGERRPRPPPTMCPVHPHRELEFFCVEDEEVLCNTCHVTRHRGHDMEDLGDAADRGRRRLREGGQKRLWRAITRLGKLSDLAQDNLRAARQKADVLKEQVNAQHDLLVKLAGELRDKVIEGLEAEMAQNIEPTLSADVRKIQETMDVLADLQQRVQHALTDNAPEAFVVSVAMEMRRGRGSARELARIHSTEDFKPRYTVRPGLHSYARTMAETLESDIVRLLGSPVTLSMLNTETMQCVPPTTPVPFYRCGQEGSCREVHALCRADDGQLRVAYGGKAPKFAEETMAVVEVPQRQRGSARRLSNTGSVKVFGLGRRITFDKKTRSGDPAIAPELPQGRNRGDVFTLHANSNGDFVLKTYPAREGGRLFRKTMVIRQQADPQTGAETVSLKVNNASKPVAFDANATGQFFVIVNEDEEDILQKSMDAARTYPQVVNTVRLYRDNCSDPIALYLSPRDERHFLPTAVSFWKHGAQDLLLIADWLGNSVHMVHVASGDFRFLCYLTAGSGDLIRPTALDVDNEKNIWIGCENGWVLECPFRTEDGDGDVDSLLSQLIVANPSTPSEGSSSSSSSQLSSEEEEEEEEEEETMDEDSDAIYTDSRSSFSSHIASSSDASR